MIVSDGDASQKFLHSVKAHLGDNMNGVQQASKSKIRSLYSAIVTINSKYNIVAKSKLKKLKTFISSPNMRRNASPFDLIDKKPQTEFPNHFVNLRWGDNTLRDIPIFLPQTYTTVTSPFGSRKHPVYGQTKFHRGVDFAASKHAMVHAAADGRVVEVGRSKSYGNFIILEHGRVLKTLYAHLSKVYVNRGERLFQGQLIGHQGNTGTATGDHLHFEIIFKGRPIDPMFFVGQEYNCRR